MYLESDRLMIGRVSVRVLFNVSVLRLKTTLMISKNNSILFGHSSFEEDNNFSYKLVHMHAHTHTHFHYGTANFTSEYKNILLIIRLQVYSFKFNQNTKS